MSELLDAGEASPLPPFPKDSNAEARERLAAAERRLAEAVAIRQGWQRQWEQVKLQLQQFLARPFSDGDAASALHDLGTLLTGALGDVAALLEQSDWKAPYWPHAHAVLLAACRKLPRERPSQHRARVAGMLAGVHAAGSFVEDAVRALCREWVNAALADRWEELSNAMSAAAEEEQKAAWELQKLGFQARGLKINPELTAHANAVAASVSAIGVEVVEPRTGDAATPKELTRAQRNERLRNMEPANRKAYLAFEFAQTKAGKSLEDREAYTFLKEEGIPDHAGELTDYKLPAYYTWTRQLRKARALLEEQKYTPRKGRPHGSSIVGQDEIEQPDNDK